MSVTLQLQTEFDILDAFVRVYEAALNSLEVYDRRRDPNELDYIIYQVTKLYHLAKFISTSTDEVLETIATSLSIFEEFSDGRGLIRN